MLPWHPLKVCSWSDYALPRIMPWVCLWGVLMGGGIMVCPVLQWVPVLEKGMEAVPEGTHVRFGQLQSPFHGSLELAHNRFLDRKSVV